MPRHKQQGGVTGLEPIVPYIINKIATKVILSLIAKYKTDKSTNITELLEIDQTQLTNDQKLEIEAINLIDHDVTSSSFHMKDPKINNNKMTYTPINKDKKSELQDVLIETITTTLSTDITSGIDIAPEFVYSVVSLICHKITNTQSCNSKIVEDLLTFLQTPDRMKKFLTDTIQNKALTIASTVRAYSQGYSHLKTENTNNLSQTLRFNLLKKPTDIQSIVKNSVLDYINNTSYSEKPLGTSPKEKRSILTKLIKNLKGNSSYRPLEGGQDTYKPTSLKHIGKDGTSRKVYQKGNTYYIKKKSTKDGKMRYYRVTAVHPAA